jgi:tRNA(fMet)-specific endonuclease VapC
MSLYVFDTDTLSLYSRGQAGLCARIDTHRFTELAITVITVEEEVSGWYRLLRTVRLAEEQAQVYQRLAEAIPLLARWRILSMTHAAVIRYEGLKS